MQTRYTYCDYNCARTSRHGTVQLFLQYFFIVVLLPGTRLSSTDSAGTTEVKYISPSKCTQIICCHRFNVKWLAEAVESTTLYEDNQPCISWPTEAGKCSKHVEISYCICPESEKQNELNIKYCYTTEMITDILMTPLGPQKSSRLMKMMPMEMHFSDKEFYQEPSFCQGSVLDRQQSNISVGTGSSPPILLHGQKML